MSNDNPMPPDEPAIPTGDATPPPPPPPPPAPPAPPAGALPPPPPAASGPADLTSGPWTLGNAFSYGWAKFQQYLGAILVALLILFVGAAILFGLWFVIVGAISSALWKPATAALDPSKPQAGAGCSATGGLELFGLATVLLSLRRRARR